MTLRDRLAIFNDFTKRRGGEIGRRTGLKIQRTSVHAGSIPAPGTKKQPHIRRLFFLWGVSFSQRSIRIFTAGLGGDDFLSTARKHNNRVLFFLQYKA